MLSTQCEESKGRKFSYQTQIGSCDLNEIQKEENVPLIPELVFNHTAYGGKLFFTAFHFLVKS